MEQTTKKCALCAEEIPIASADCPYCGAKYSVTSDGYCLNCHEFRQADEAGKCKTCGSAVADWRVESEFIGEPDVAPAAAPALARPGPAPQPVAKPPAPKPVGKQRAIALLGIVLAVVGLAILFWAWRARTPAAVVLIPTAAPSRAAALTAPPTNLPAETATATTAPTKTARPSPTITPIPAWVAEFAGPLLANLANRPPNFKDDVSNEKNSRYYWGKKPGITFENGVLHLTKTNGGLDAGHGRVNDDTPDFVLEYEMTPRSIDPRGGVHVVFRHTNQGYYALGFFRDGAWNIVYSDKTGDHTITGGKTEQLGIDQKTKVTLIVRRDELALYLNGQPAGYGRYTAPMDDNEITFSLWAPGGTTAADFDNIKLWNLNSLKPKSQ